MANRLEGESSPYLLQHAGNPVAWYPWGSEAFEAARRDNKPIFLSIGYSACHWCHVMEHESFENADIARTMNERFINIKVDREERPDLDQVYMQAVQMLTGRGGWPMSVFLNHELRPFFGGTYWPPTRRAGMSGFVEVLNAVSEAWTNRREVVDQQAGELTTQLARDLQATEGAGTLTVDLLTDAANKLSLAFDSLYGGFGGAPKFPHPMDLRLLLRVWSRNGRADLLHVVTHTLNRMAAGGIYDHLGGGFHRYSVDERWLVPHFEKMLYDNALLAGCYLDAYQATGQSNYRRVVVETLDYLLEEMTGTEGGLFSTQDADSEGEEGKFYVWTPDELRDVLGEESAATFARIFDVSADGNFEGKNILNLSKTIEQCAALMGRSPVELAAEIASARHRLYAARRLRVAPGLDDKVLVSWNGLAIDALAYAGAVLSIGRYIEAARRAAQFIQENLTAADGTLLHTWRAGRARQAAFLDDYACLGNALVSLYEATFDETWISRALGLVDQMIAQFADPGGGGFFYARAGDPSLIARQKDLQDSSVPSGNSMAVTVLSRLGRLCNRDDYLGLAERTLNALAPWLQRSPAAFAQMLIALDTHLGPSHEVVLLADGQDRPEAISTLQRAYWPRKVFAARPAAGHEQALDSLFAGRRVVDGQPTMYVCQDRVCQAPAVGLHEIGAAIPRMVGAPD